MMTNIKKLFKEKKLRKKYNKLVRDVESMQIYDGRGKGIDVYVCDTCGAKFFTRYANKGVTPFVTYCRKCQVGAAMHRTTISEDQFIHSYLAQGLHEWKRPSFEQFLKLSPEAQNHVLQGGLILDDNF